MGIRLPVKWALWRVNQKAMSRVMTSTTEALHHLVAVSAPNGTDPNGLKRLYVDGQLLSESARDPIGVPGTNNRVRIGDNPSTGAREWNGLVDDVAIWARALTDEEVATLWNDGNGRSVGSLIQGTTVVPANFVAVPGTLARRASWALGKTKWLVLAERLPLG